MKEKVMVDGLVKEREGKRFKKGKIDREFLKE